MKAAEILRDVQRESGISQDSWARLAGYASQGTISNTLRSNMRVDKLVKLSNVLGAEVVIRKGDEEWVITE